MFAPTNIKLNGESVEIQCVSYMCWGFGRSKGETFEGLKD
ncbi:MAG: hypothetical protein H6Q17_2397 [Bacteroidetes bacterium]|nr:hypothetical protein [Bacteroidota bacterium]